MLPSVVSYKFPKFPATGMLFSHHLSKTKNQDINTLEVSEMCSPEYYCLCVCTHLCKIHNKKVWLLCGILFCSCVPDKCFTSFQSPRVESVLLHTVCIKSNCSPTYTLNKQRYIWLAEAEGFTCCKFDFLGKQNSIQTESLPTDHVIM